MYFLRMQNVNETKFYLVNQKPLNQNIEIPRQKIEIQTSIEIETLFDVSFHFFFYRNYQVEMSNLVQIQDNIKETFDKGVKPK